MWSALTVLLVIGGLISLRLERAGRLEAAGASGRCAVY